MVKAVPEEFRTVTAGLCVSPADETIAFYEKALGAKTLMRMAMKGKVGHAELKIGDSIIFLSDEFPEMPGCRSPRTLKGTTSGIYLYVPDVDAAFAQAVKAGARVRSQDPPNLTTTAGIPALTRRKVSARIEHGL